MYVRAFIPACEGFGWSGGPEFKTRIRVLANGRERRNADWAQECNRYTLPFLNLGAEQYRSIRQMFQVCRGMAHDFLYRDPLDFEADTEEFGIGDGAAVEFQLSKLSAIEGVIYQREVHALYVPGSNGSDAEPSSIAVTVNGVPTSVTVNYDRGTVVFAAPPAIGAVLRWSGQFAVWVRFDIDWLPFSIDDRRGSSDYARNGQIVLKEDHPPEAES